MFDIGWTELLVIGAVALVAIGPKDLPKVMHALGKVARKGRLFVQEMQASFEEMEASELEKKTKEDKKDEA